MQSHKTTREVRSTTLSRPISLADHHARRRKARAARIKEEIGNSSHSHTSQQRLCDNIMGVEHDAASFGAYDGNSSCGSKLLDGEHACYSAERCIERSDGGRGVVSPARSSFSSPDLDFEDCYYDSCSNGRSVGATSGYVSRGSATRTSSVGNRASHPSSEDSLVSVDVGYDSSSRFDCSITTSTIDEGISYASNYSSQCQDEEDAIKAGIMDISVFLATYLAGGMSFVIGIFLALLSPVFRLIKLIFGDLTGLIGDAFGLALRNNPGLFRDLQGIRRMFQVSRSTNWRSSGSYSSQGPQNYYRQHQQSYRYGDGENDCEASLGSGYTHETSHYSHATDEASHVSPQYIGGWSPSIASSRGSNSRGSYSNSSSGYLSSGIGHTASSYGSAGRTNRSRSSKSYSSLPQVQEDDSPPCHHYSYYPDDVSVSTSASTGSKRLMLRLGSGRRDVQCSMQER